MTLSKDKIKVLSEILSKTVNLLVRCGKGNPLGAQLSMSVAAHSLEGKFSIEWGVGENDFDLIYIHMSSMEVTKKQTISFPQRPIQIEVDTTALNIGSMLNKWFGDNEKKE